MSALEQQLEHWPIDRLVEEWRSVPGFDAFEVSSLGRLRRVRSCRGTPAAEKKPTQGPDGYWRTSLEQKGRRRDVTLHRLVCEVFHGPSPTRKSCVAHFDGDKSNNAASNLRWATYSENETDKRRHGKDQRGERNGAAKLDAAIVRYIRSLDLSARGAAAQAAREISVSPSVICNIRKRKSWTHVS